ncbi:MAG: nickel-dependent hydrogenase large subunit [Deltaproteobacteria bacterium]|nr:nickel-dependent hydrogenase large subunit [Deltaproteobacteria bacterium]
MAAAKNVGFAYGFNVHDEDATIHASRPDTDDIPEAGHLVRDIIYGSNFVASHIVHFYHLAALDFVDASQDGLGLNKGPLCPRYGPTPGAVDYGYYYRFGTLVTKFLTAKYVLALQFRRMCNQIGGLWGGRAPFIQGLTPGGASPSVSQEAIDKTRELLYEGGVGGTPTAPAAGTILAFIGTPFDFANYVGNTTVLDFSNLPIVGTTTDPATPFAGSHLFDVVAAASFYPEYFWLGNAYERFLAYGVFEKGDLANAIGDNRLLSRGRKNTGAKYSNQTGVLPATFSGPKPAEWQPALQQNVLENIESSHYLYNGGKGGWKQPLQGETTPEPRRIPNPQIGDPAYPDKGAYSWIKSPRYKDTADGLGPAVPYEAGPLARMQVNGDYYAGILYDLGAMGTSAALPFTNGVTIPLGPFAGVPLPQYGAPGPNLGAIFTGMGTMPDLGPAGYNLTYTGGSCLDRYAARQLECWKVANAMVGWLNRLEAQVGAETSTTRDGGGADKYYSSSYGWTEAPRGALGHWMKTNMSTGKIENYQCVVPSTWNASPRDSFGVPGPAEKAMEDVFVKDTDHPLEILRVSHSWDFCTACAVHLVKKNGRGKTEEKTIYIDPAPTCG